MQHYPSASDTFQIRLEALKALGNDYFELILSRPDNFNYDMGQRIRFLNDDLERDYSLISIPTDRTLAIYLRLIPGGRFSPKLIRAAVGTEFTITGPHGHFRFHSSHRKAVCIATGTGLAPFVAFARSGIKGVTLLHGIRDAKELHYHTLFAANAFDYIACFAQKEPLGTGSVKCHHGKVSHYLSQCLPQKKYDFYVCGGTTMIRDVTHIIDRLFPDSYLFYETFY